MRHLWKRREIMVEMKLHREAGLEEVGAVRVKEEASWDKAPF